MCGALIKYVLFFFFSSRRRHTSSLRDWSSDVCSSDLVAPHRLHRVRRAGRVEAAGRRQERRDEPPVQPEERQHEGADHGPTSRVGAASRARRAPSSPARGALERATTTRSMGGSRAAEARNASRTHRFTRFRTTALPTRVDTVTPRRGRPRSFGRARTTYAPAWTFLPRSCTARNSLRRVRRAALPSRTPDRPVTS